MRLNNYVELCFVNCVHVSSTIEVEKLIKAVRYFPCLWDLTKMLLQGPKSQGKCLEGSCDSCKECFIPRSHLARFAARFGIARFYPGWRHIHTGVDYVGHASL